ncbi:MAG: metallophosphoesterase [Nanoarchaeota archaeon]|nr:metallophosphoesterase [Nanoarchaeota archaeon]MCG2717213.1 metallophosphoesterase [Nanoarchaeota archaeon]
MDRILQLSIFISIFSLIVLGLHYYVLFRIFGLLSLKKSYLSHLIVIGLSFSFVAANFLVSKQFNLFTRAFYAVSSSWMGILFFLFSTLIIYEVLKFFIKFDPKHVGMTILIIVGIISIFSIINAQFVTVRTVSIPDFPEKLRAVQITDMHIGTLYNHGYIKNVVDNVNKLDPDVVFITGDLVSGGAKLRPGMFDELKKIKAKTFFVYGNHEFYEDLKEFDKVFSTTGIKILHDEVVEFNGVQILGTEFFQGGGFHGESGGIPLKELLEKVKVSEEKPLIILKHIPGGLEGSNADLILSGHTHAGQIFPFTVFTRMATKYVSGLYKDGKTNIYVSAGTGTWGPPMRFGSRNEITLFELGS